MHISPALPKKNRGLLLGLALSAAAACAMGGSPATAADSSDWPSYNRTLTSVRYSPLSEIDQAQVRRLGIVCSFDTGEKTAFQSGLVQVNGALFATTEHDTISLNPDTCKVNWRAHEDFPSAFLGAQRGVAVANGRVYRGGTNGHVYAYDERTGARVWDRVIADSTKGESVPSAPIAWKGMVFVGSAGGDNRSVKGRMYGLDGATGKVSWEFYLVPRGPHDPIRGPQAPGAPSRASWGSASLRDITGGGTWTSYSIDPQTGALYVPGGNPAPDFVGNMRTGDNLFSGSIVALDAKTGRYRAHYQLAANDFHDWDASSAPVIFKAQSGRRLMATAPKDGFLYLYDLTSGRRIFRQPLTTITNTDVPLTPEGVRFCPGTVGGAEWNGPAYDPSRHVLFTGHVDWCSTVHLDPNSKTQSVSAAQPWTGSSKDGFGTQDDASLSKGWLVATDVKTGARRWTFKTPYPVLGGVTPTAGSIVVFGDMGGNLYALNSDTGEQLWSTRLDGAVAGGVVSYDTGAGQKVAVSAGMTSPIWPTAKVTAKIYVLGLK